MQITRLLGDNRAVATRESQVLEIDISLLESPEVGEYVIVHAGFALEIIEHDDAVERIAFLTDIDA